MEEPPPAGAANATYARHAASLSSAHICASTGVTPLASAPGSPPTCICAGTGCGSLSSGRMAARDLALVGGRHGGRAISVGASGQAKSGGRAAARWPLGADVAGVSPVPAQMWQGRAQVLVHWQFRCRCGTAQFRCRCGRGWAQFRCRCGQRMWAAVYQPGPGADLAGGEPSPGADVARPRPALALPPKSMRTRGCGPAAASGGAGIGAGARPLLRLPTLVGRSGSS
jgi:hypothetical protein